MALKLRKDIKKSSYYVWFLGAKESKGLRGSEYIIPVVKHLEEREKDVEPFKVTLQVSHKGLKIVQNVVSQGAKNSKPKNETIKHFIPHNTITYVYQHEDIIACILLLFNPVTKCPLHVHAYRCDSLETASHLKQQLQILIERPENQKKIAEIENRLKPVEKTKKLESSIGSDTGTSTRESESSEERYALENSRISTLYDSVAAELREKLGKKNSPILLPPRDYDTVHRQKGNLTGIELRRCLNANIVGQNVKNKRLESSGGSSGIGSDHPPSPESPDTPDSRFHTLETHHSTSEDEDWSGDPADSSIYLMQDTQHMTLPRPFRNQESFRESSRENISREKSPEIDQRYSRYTHDELKFSKSLDEDYRKSNNKIKYLEKPISKFSDNKYLLKQKSSVREREVKDDYRENEREIAKENFRKSLEKELLNRNGNKYLEKSIISSERYFGEEEKKDTYYYNERERNGRYSEDRKKSEKEKYFEDDGFDENIRSRNNSSDFDKERPTRTFSYEEEVFFEDQKPYKEYPVPKTRQKFLDKEDSGKSYRDNKESREIRAKVNSNDSRYYESKSLQRNRDYERDYNNDSKQGYRYEAKPEYFENSTNSINRRQPQFRQRSPPDEEIKVPLQAPKDRFMDAKEKFLLMEKERLEQERRRPEPPISPTIQKDKIHFIKRHQSMAYTSKDHLRNNYEDRFSNERRDFSEDISPKPAPRQVSEEVRYRNHRDKDVDRYRNTDKYDPKRRSMFSLIEEEHKKNSNEIAKELKRRSYMDVGHHALEDQKESFRRSEEREVRSSRHYQDLPEAERYGSSLVDNFSKSTHNLDKMSDSKYDQKFIKNPQKMMKSVPGYRHSYAEPKIRIEPRKKNVSDMLHRTNSSVGYMQPRVGIASIHPY
ncbi:trichohyalin isoform X1 [Sitophilus oryzae]|uniref:Trichohyalin isoform X1 n=1 Tax=Sitophilus oryzae TaxID=7048 RepID=A0A6J2XW77_SITOR|nr:trichohyalin isoform X1 [Sitophilus oryzae]